MSDDWDKQTVLRGGQKRVATVTKSESAVNNARRMGIAVSTESKGAGGSNSRGGPTDYQRIAKLDLENEVKPPSLINSDVGKAIAKARMDKKNPDGKSWTQKDLATKVNEKPQVIADYESSKAVPNVALLGKIERQLGVKLRGDPKLIGTPLPGPGSKKK